MRPDPPDRARWPACAALFAAAVALMAAPTGRAAAVAAAGAPALAPGRRLAQQLRGAGVRVWAMSGHAAWAERPARARAWAAGVARARTFDGAVLDIEPYLLPAWRERAGRRRLVRGYLKALAGARARLGGLQILTAVPFWFDHDAQRYRGEPLTAAVLERSDGVVVMAYRDHAFGSDGILALSEGELALARAAHKVAWIGVQTAADALDKLTFFEEGQRRLEQTLASVTVLLGARREFAGVSVHHFAAQRTLRP